MIWAAIYALHSRFAAKTNIYEHLSSGSHGMRALPCRREKSALLFVVVSAVKLSIHPLSVEVPARTMILRMYSQHATVGEMKRRFPRAAVWQVEF